MNKFAVQNLFGINGFNIAWYGVIITIGMILGVLLAMYRTKKRGINPDIILDFVFIALPLAIIGARAYYVIFKWEDYSDNIINVFAVNKGGLAIYGGVIGGFIAAFIFAHVKKISFFTFIDLSIPSLILGQAVGRWGNFVNQEAFGNIVTNPKFQFFPLAVYIDNLNQWHQATFFYESTWNFILLVIVLLLGYKRVKDGILLSTYFIGYGLGRFLIEGLRTDSLYVLPGIRVSQMLSLILIAAGMVLLVLINKDVIKIRKYSGKYSV